MYLSDKLVRSGADHMPVTCDRPCCTCNSSPNTFGLEILIRNSTSTSLE
jgi:hypothetical protein